MKKEKEEREKSKDTLLDAGFSFDSSLPVFKKRSRKANSSIDDQIAQEYQIEREFEKIEMELRLNENKDDKFDTDLGRNQNERL